MLAIGEDVKGMLDFMRPIYALYVGGMGARGKNFYNDLACQYGYEKEAKEIQDLYLDGKKKDAEALVPLEWLEAGNLVGPESYVKERIEAFREAGITNLSVDPGQRRPGRDHRAGQGMGELTQRASEPSDHVVGGPLEAGHHGLEGEPTQLRHGLLEAHGVLGRARLAAERLEHLGAQDLRQLSTSEPMWRRIDSPAASMLPSGMSTSSSPTPTWRLGIAT